MFINYNKNTVNLNVVDIFTVTIIMLVFMNKGFMKIFKSPKFFKKKKIKQ